MDQKEDSVLGEKQGEEGAGVLGLNIGVYEGGVGKGFRGYRRLPDKQHHCLPRGPGPVGLLLCLLSIFKNNFHLYTPSSCSLLSLYLYLTLVKTIIIILLLQTFILLLFQAQHQDFFLYQC